MAITVTPLTSGFNNTSTTSYTTASISPTGNRLVIAACGARTGGAQVAPTASGGGLTTITQIINRIDGGTRGLSFFRALQASPGSGAVTFDFGAIVQSWCLWSIFELDGIDTSGSNGAGAIVQSLDSIVNTGTSLTITMAAFGAPENMALGAFYATDPGVPDTEYLVGSGFTKIDSFRDTLSDSGLLTEYKLNDNTIDASFRVSDTIGLGVEVKAAAGGGGGPPLDSDYLIYQTQQRWRR